VDAANCHQRRPRSLAGRTAAGSVERGRRTPAGAGRHRSRPLERLLRSALPLSGELVPSRDLWPSILGRTQARPGLTAWSWLDISMAAVVVTVLVMFPDWLWLVFYHL
jgi:hypothetical protein